MIEVVPGGPELEESVDLLIVPVFADLVWGPGAAAVAEDLGSWLDPFLEAREFTGAAGQLVAVPGGSRPPRAGAFVGRGAAAAAATLRRAAGAAGRFAGPYRTVATTLGSVEIDGAEDAVVVGYLLGSYRYDDYRSEPKPRVNERLELLDATAGADEAIMRAAAVVRGVTLARDLINRPAVDKAPATLAQMALELDDRIAVEVFDEVEAAELGYGGLIAVGSGAANPPRMVVLRYEPSEAVASVAFVGKGIVFDSGGLSLKQAAMMETMKTDMSGAATVFGAMLAIAELDLPIRVLGVAPLAENMTGGAAQRPGDVFTAYRGRTVEVLNTDAEGRLVLADGLGIAVEAEPDLIVDIATLTGAAKVALGPSIGAIFGNDDEAVEAVEAAARFCGEPMWTMPLERSYRDQLKSTIADLKNIGTRFGGAITAALFLSEFVDDRPWVHLDIAGPARAEKAEHYISAGGTGFAVRTLVELAREMAMKA
jgi:leucyl aminopeptidase